MKSLFAFLGSAAILSSFICAQCLAQGIYRWEDEEGVVHYSSKKTSAEAELAELPEITRGEFKTAMKKGFSCEKHGGINCQAGTDSDGSVICFDGFKEAAARYSFHCNSPKLIVSDISELSEAGEFKVFVRNSRSVVAKEPRVEFHLPDDKIVSLVGPGEIEPFGIGEFTFQPQPELKLQNKPREAQLSLNCANCG